MGEGFLLEMGGYGEGLITEWVEGAPDFRKWMGVRLKGRARLKVESFRCERCYYLESYAPPAREG
jgi:hypothetical protein